MTHIRLLVLRPLLERPLRTLLTMFGIVLGVGVVLAINITNRTTLDSITTVFNAASGKANLVVTGSSAGDQGFPEDALQPVAAVPGVAAAVPSIHVQALLADEAPPSQVDISFFGAVADGFTLYGIDPTVDILAREYEVVAGRFLLPDLNGYDVVLVKPYADEHDIRVGHDLQILTPEGIEILRVVGLISKEGPGRLNNGAFGVMPLEAAQQIFGRRGELDQIDVVVAPELATGARLDNLKTTLQARLGRDYTVVYPANQGKRVTQMLDAYQIGLNFFSVIALFVGAFLIYNAFSMTVVERTREIGMLRTLGMTRRQIMRQVLTEAGILGAVGSALGVAAGILLSYGLIRAMELLLAQEVTQIRLPLEGLVASVVVGICVTLTASAIPSWQASRISPLDAVRIRGNPHESWIIRRGWTVGVGLSGTSALALYVNPFPALQYQLGGVAVFALFVGATLLIPITVGSWERAARPWVRRIYGSAGQLGSGNIQRAKLRTTLTVAALMIGVAMILSIRSMTNAYEQDIRAWMENYIGGDLYVHSTLPMRADLARRLEAVEGVAAATPVRYFDVEWQGLEAEDVRLTFMATDPSSYQRVTSFVFATKQSNPDRLLKRLAEGNAVFISSVLSEKYGLKPGDTIRLRTRRGQQDFEVVAAVVNFQNQGLIIEGSWKDMRRYFGLNDVSAFLIKLQPGYPSDVAQAHIDRFYGQRRHLTVESNQAIKARAFQLTDRAFGLFDVLVFVAIIVAGLGVINTLTMNVLERTQEIGMLRGIGMTRRQVRQMILAEAGMMGLMGGAFGIAFGLFLSRLFLIAATTTQGYEITYVLPIQGILVSLLIALVVSQLAAIWPARRAAGMRIIEAIQYE